MQVRGQEVVVSSYRFVDFLDIEAPRRCEFEEFKANATIEDMQKILDRVAKPGAEWEPHDNYMHRQFKAAGLLPETNVWINFIKHSLLPTSHDTKINVEKMILLYCVVEGKDVDVGDLIIRSIKYCARRKTGKLFFPCLITRYLVERGVPQFKDDLIVREGEGEDRWTIDLKSVTRLRKEKAVDKADMGTMLQNLLAQNSTLVDGLLQQRNEFMDKFKDIQTDLKAQFTEETKKIKEEVKNMRVGMETKHRVQVNRMKTKMESLTREVKKLKTENEKLRMDALVNAAAAEGSRRDTSPTPKE